MKMDATSLGDEVRFAASPDIIADDVSSGELGYHPDYVRTKTPRERKLRMQVVMNKQGYVELNLGKQDLRDLPTELFNFTRIEVLKVNHNRLQTLPSAISHLRKLRTLHAQNNTIIALPDTISNCIHLTEVDLSHNTLSSLPVQISALRELRVLRMNHNKFESLPHEVGDLAALRTLELAGNKLWHLPYSLQNLSHLRNLNLSNNAFEQMPISVCHIRALEALDLHGNKLLTMPPEMENLRHLRELSLARNRFETLPYTIAGLKSLHSIDLSHNHLQSLPPRLTKLPKLRMLVANNNHISALPANMEALEYLNLANNKLRNFSVARMRRLRHLNASHNQLENLPLGVFNLRQMSVLKLSHNRISYVSQDIGLLKKLRTFDISYNHLNSLPQTIYELDNLENFNIQNNPLETRPPHPSTRGPAPFRQRGIERRPMMMPPYPPPMDYVPAPHRHSPPSGRRNSPKRYDTEPEDHYEDMVGEEFQPQYRRTRYKKTGHKGKKKHIPKKSTGKRHVSHSKTAVTQHTPKSTLRTKSPPVLDHGPKIDATTSYHTNPSSRHHTRPNSPILPVEANGLVSAMSYTRQNSHPNSTHNTVRTGTATPKSQRLPHNDVHAHFETTTNTVAKSNPPSIHHKDMNMMKEVSSYTREWVNGSKPVGGSFKSDMVTVNDTVGDQLSLGEQEFEFQPTTVTDYRLLGVASEVEAMLNQQLLSPFGARQGLFRKSINKNGTLRTLNGILGQHFKGSPITSPSLPQTPTSYPSPHTTLHPCDQAVSIQPSTENPYSSRWLSSPQTEPTSPRTMNALLRTKTDIFKITPGGGMFKSTVDPNVSIYFPVKAIEHEMTVMMQIEKLDADALLRARQENTIIDNIIDIGQIIHITQSLDMDFLEQVTLTIPAPSSDERGKLHIMTYHGDNTCTPCVAPYKFYKGYLSIQSWHFSGKGAVLTKSRCKYKACKSVEQFLQYLYL